MRSTAQWIQRLSLIPGCFVLAASTWFRGSRNTECPVVSLGKDPEEMNINIPMFYDMYVPFVMLSRFIMLIS